MGGRLAARGAGFQRVYTSEVEGRPAFGWVWRWRSSGMVVAYPEILCGEKPWNAPTAEVSPIFRRVNESGFDDASMIESTRAA